MHRPAANKALKEQRDEIGTGGGGWLEPAKVFLRDCNRAYSVAFRLRRKENPPARKAFLKKIGSNFLLHNRTVQFSYNLPFDRTVKYAGSKEWLCLSDEIRSYFQSEYA